MASNSFINYIDEEMTWIVELTAKQLLLPPSAEV